VDQGARMDGDGRWSHRVREMDECVRERAIG